MNLIPITSVIVGTAAVANAAISDPQIRWEVSTDSGDTWGPSVQVSGGVVKVRGTLSWNRGEFANSAFAALLLDGHITGCGAESTGAMIKPLQQAIGNQPGLGVNLGNGELRFGRNTDSGSAGSNNIWWTIAQDANIDTDGDGIPDSFPGQNTSDPVTFLTFDVNIDSSVDHLMTINSVLAPHIQSQFPVVIWPNPGTTVRFAPEQVTQISGTINVVVPAPPPLAALGLAAILTARRRR